MGIEAKVIADSISPDGKRLTTMVWRYPRFVHSEIMTHRVFSRNAASSRAIPVAKLLEQVRTNPALPSYWGRNQAGMQAQESLTEGQSELAKETWLSARNDAVKWVEELHNLGLHKQIANRILEPWMWMVTIVSATDWSNFYHLRRHPDAQPEFKVLADAAYEAHMASIPGQTENDDWHLPFVSASECSDPIYSYDDLRKMSVARCARVSYLNHDGTQPDAAKDIALHDRLAASGHFSPFEHVARPQTGRHANFDGWRQYRLDLPNQNRTQYPGL